MNYDELKSRWKNEEKMSFKGWDFSHLENRWECEELPWSYRDIILKYLEPNHKLLDIGTGSGEFLLSLNHPYKNTSVTEMWEPNVKFCREKLSPLGIDVNQTFDDEKLPFGDNTFDIIINRQASYNIKEIKRILKPNGMLITQQVGSLNNERLSKLLGMKNNNHKVKNLEKILIDADNNHLDVIYSDEYFPYFRFKDIGAFVYYAKIIVWEFQGFSVDKCFDILCDMNKELNKKGYIESLAHRYILVCKNNK
ncbi:class I SAM-dependent methyltransferase [Clostridium sp. B9]|uniref:class I SAM-dependent methyltransferase n=1 Tax=Clostridium sp. B9 TaxID=3423224 RepID=UPI003D2EE97D